MEVLGKLFDEDQVHKIMTTPVVGIDIKDARVWRVNQAARVMAKEGKNWPETKVWIDEALKGSFQGGTMVVDERVDCQRRNY
ncbi:hypothetical protein Gotri_026887 [Gossypium trilobum]|uniref:Uncharacterized protein n=1 Tax=Gossypium trilobum TaxID=34281 RepID=A0A7J9FQ24_9ROSI|nr:hypothetical protein [Gossypium trilobum]